MRFGFTLQDKFGIFIAAIITVVIAGLSFFFYVQLDDSMMNSLRSQLLLTSKLVAAHIDAGSIPVIMAGNEKSKLFWDLKKYLKDIQLQDPKIRGIYVMVSSKKPNIWKFVADEDFDPKTRARLGEEYDTAQDPEMRQAFSGALADHKINGDKWGRWLSGFAPVHNFQGQPVAIVGVDISVADIDNAKRQIRDLVIVSFAIGLILAIIFGRIGAITITNPIMALLSGVQNIEEGKYGFKINIFRKDELGSLVTGFNRMSDKLGELEKLKADFLSVISHELYTPITPIKDSSSQLLESKTMSETDRQLVTIIHRQIGKMQNLVDEMLDFSWLEIKEWKLEREPVSLKLLAEDAVEQARKPAESKGLELTLKLGEDLPTAMMDKKRITHVLKILLDNAVKFTPENGKIKLEINKVSGGVEFSVTDTGIGISKENLERIFSGFFQVEDHMTRTKGGVGLGLAIAKRIVEAHNGYIWAESQGLGEGSRFMFLLPIA
ncbi:MAG TPA: HAMP domain-containing sensor histidine kinase [Candidatus Omnitrophota bacterium]|nr:HAMP domain-containing sensor histidine kinase [Candidatus Omnitrophota bacterium]